MSEQDKGLWTAEFGQIGATLKALQDQGVTLHDLKRLRSDPAFALRVARLIRCGWTSDWTYPPYDETESQRRVRAQIPENFFGINEVQRLGMQYLHEELDALAVIPPELLENWVDTDYVFPGFPISCDGLARILQHKPEVMRQSDEKLMQQDFASRKAEVRWHRISSPKFYHTGDKAYAAELALMLAVYATTKGESAFDKCYGYSLVCRDECMGVVRPVPCHVTIGGNTSFCFSTNEPRERGWR